MTRLFRFAAPLAAIAALGGCSLGGLLGGGGKPPVVLYTLTPTAPPAAALSQQVSAGSAVTIRVPTVAKELRTTRVPVQIGTTQVQYLTDLTWVDTPDRLFQSLLSETVRRTTGRVVLAPDQGAVDPGTVVTGVLQQFGYDARRRVVMVRYDAAVAAADGSTIRSRTFTAETPADGTAATVAPALNQAANQVAGEVASWIGG